MTKVPVKRRGRKRAKVQFIRLDPSAVVRYFRVDRYSFSSTRPGWIVVNGREVELTVDLLERIREAK